MKKIIRLGTKPDYDNHRPAMSIFCSIDYKNGNLSISGVEEPMSNGDARGSCGQIESHLTAESITPANGWTKEDIEKFLTLWRAWHLNDMRSGCIHQRKNWNTSEKIILHEYSWSMKYYNIRQKAESGDLSIAEYTSYRELAKRVESVTTAIDHPKWESPLVKELLEEGMIEEKKTEEKTAGWITPKEHPKGLLTKPCKECGYKYGSAWLKEEVPADVIKWLFSRPDTDITPAWV